jgi:hypothetical protein
MARQALRAARRGTAAEFADRAAEEVTSGRAYRAGVRRRLAQVYGTVLVALGIRLAVEH